MGITRPATLRIAGAFLAIAAVAACAVAYGTFVVEQRQYFTGRNFRLLSTLARQFDGAVEAEARVLANLAGDVNADASPSDYSNAATKKWLRLRENQYSATDVEFKKPLKTLPRPDGEYDFDAGPRFRLNVHVRSRGESGEPLLFAQLRMQPVLGPIFPPKTAPQGPFDTVLLANTSEQGDVRYAVGARAHELQSTGLASLLRQKSEGGDQPRPFADLVRTTSVNDVSIAGVQYKLFIQPCCASTLGNRPLVLAGLVESDTLRSQSWEIPTTLVKLAVMLILIALIAWPFLKLALIGDRQKVRASDFFQLGASSIAGLAIVTIAFLDIAAYRQLNSDTDGQLEVSPSH